MKKVMACVLLAGWAVSASAENLLKNSGFNEIDPDSGGLAGYPASWQVFGTANRSRWRSRDEGKWSIGVCGLWAEIGNNARIVQGGVPVKEGKTYRLSAFFWADPEWIPRTQTMKITFYGEDTGAELATEEMSFRGIRPVWTNQTLLAVAPAGVQTASVVIEVNGVSMRGGLTIDDVSFEEVAATE